MKTTKENILHYQEIKPELEEYGIEKDDVVESYHVDPKEEERIDFMKLSNTALKKVWDNEEDSVYDQFIK